MGRVAWRDKYHGGAPTDHWHKFQGEWAAQAASVSSATGAAMVGTLWSFISAASAIAQVTTATVACTPKPNVGDLMVMSWTSVRTTAFTSAAVTDTGSGGWQTINSILTAGTFTTQQCWWKVATAADFNNGTGITVTVTGTGGSGTFSQLVEADVFRLPSGYAVIGIDLARGLVGGSTVSTLSWSPTVGSFYSGFTDALAFTSWSSPLQSSSGGVTGTNTFNGTSAAANLATTIATNNGILLNQYVGGVQTSATAGTNVFENTWTTARGPIVTGATFVYRQTLWSYISQSSVQSSSLTTAAVTAAPTPTKGDLMVCTWGGVHGTTAFTSAAIADTGSGGWTSVSPGFQTRSTLTSQTWWKVATAADAAATITVTASGGSGTITAAIEADVFRLPAGYSVVGIDISGGATPTAALTTSWHPGSGAGQPNATDVLAYAVATSPTSSRGLATGTNTFTGTSAAATLAPCFNTALVDFINGQYTGGVQASTTAASDTWQLTWSNSVGPNVVGATFYYQQNITSSEPGSGVEATGTNTLSGQTETGSGADGLGTLKLGSQPESGSGADAVAVIYVFSSETGSGSDAATIAAAIAGAETGSGADAPKTVALSAQAETGSGSEAQTLTTATTGAETGSGAEGLGSLGLTSVEAGASVEAIGGISLAQAETGSGVDAGTTLVPVSGSESGSGTDAQGYSAAVTSAETGTGADAQTGLSLTSAETGSGADQAVLVTVHGAETGSGTEANALTLGGQEAGASIDTGTLAVTVSSSEAGAGVDANATTTLGAGETGHGVDVGVVLPAVFGFCSITVTGATGAVITVVGGTGASISVQGGTGAEITVTGAPDAVLSVQAGTGAELEIGAGDGN